MVSPVRFGHMYLVHGLEPHINAVREHVHATLHASKTPIYSITYPVGVAQINEHEIPILNTNFFTGLKDVSRVRLMNNILMPVYMKAHSLYDRMPLLLRAAAFIPLLPFNLAAKLVLRIVGGKPSHALEAGDVIDHINNDNFNLKTGKPLH